VPRHLRDAILLADPAALAVRTGSAESFDGELDRAMPAPSAAPMELKMARGMAMAAEPEAQAAPIAVRSDFNPLAVFVPAARTDANGRVVLDYKLPDNLTRYRIMVLAAAGSESFGKAETQITVRLPLMVRPSAPRFLNFGDRFELPLVIQNQTDRELEVTLAARAQNA